MTAPVKNLQQTDEFANMVNLIAVYYEASNQLASLENTVNDEYLECIDGSKGEYAKLQKILQDTEKALEVVALKHPEWFGKKRSLKTPYGTLKLGTSTKLDIPNEEVTMLLIEQEGEKNKGFDAGIYIHSKKTLDREALEKCDDATLTKWRVKRISTETFSVVPARIDLGKAVKEAAVREAK